VIEVLKTSYYLIGVEVDTETLFSSLTSDLFPTLFSDPVSKANSLKGSSMLPV